MLRQKIANNHILITFLIFVGVAVSHFLSSVITSTDSRLTVPVAVSIIREGNINVDEYMVPLRLNAHIAKKFNGHYYNCFPLGASIIALPFVYVIDKILPGVLSFPTIKEYLKRRSGSISTVLDVVKLSKITEVFVASIVVAITAVFIYSIGLLFTAKVYALLITFVFAFCTSAWSTASRGLWQHGPSMLMLTVALYLILLAKRKAWIVQFVGLPLAFSYVIRPTNSISIILLSAFVLIQHPRYFLKYALWFLTIGVPFFATNLIWYKTYLPYYYTTLYSFSAPTVFEGLTGTLISPSRGLFVYSPILLVSLWGMIWQVRNRRESLDYFIIGIILLHWVVVSSVPKWWGGHSYGPRYFCDMMPYFIYFLIPAIESFREARRYKRAVISSIFGMLLLFSFLVHFRGANSAEAWGWNGGKTNVDTHPERLWDWRDIQFLRGI